VVFTVVNVASCYWSICKYAKYFATRYPKIVEDEKAVEVVLRLENEERAESVDLSPLGLMEGRRFTVTVLPGKLHV
jgi:hypothetical protein